MKKARAESRAKRGKKNVGAVAWWFLGIVTILMCGCVGVAVWASQEFEANKVATRAFQEIAQSYYENYMYPKFLEQNKGADLEEMFSGYEEHGFAMVRLRQILNFFGAKGNAFENSKITCDVNTSNVLFIPQAPFGKTDYLAQYVLDCEDKD